MSKNHYKENLSLILIGRFFSRDTYILNQ